MLLLCIDKDASRAFVTGEFEKDLNDKVDDLSDTQISDLFGWKKFYDKTYKHIGVVMGRFYDQSGIKTDYMINLEAAIGRHAEVTPTLPTTLI